LRERAGGGARETTGYYPREPVDHHPVTAEAYPPLFASWHAHAPPSRPLTRHHTVWSYFKKMNCETEPVWELYFKLTDVNVAVSDAYIRVLRRRPSAHETISPEFTVLCSHSYFIRFATLYVVPIYKNNVCVIHTDKLCKYFVRSCSLPTQ